VNQLIQQIRKLIFASGKDEEGSRYHRMWRNTVITFVAVSIIPLLGITGLNYYLYHQSYQNELHLPILRTTSITKRSVESFIEERIAAARYVLSRERLADLSDPVRLATIFTQMRTSFGGIVDIGVVGHDGVMRTYAGPYNLTGKDYQDQNWFGKMLVREIYVSDVFLGHRQLPHFVVAVKREDELGRPVILRATIDAERMVRKIQIKDQNNSDAFLVNRAGALQTPSRLFGQALNPFLVSIPDPLEGSGIMEEVVVKNHNYIMSYAAIKHSPFLFVLMVNSQELQNGWLTYQREMLAFLGISILAMVLIIMGITSSWITRIRDADLRRQASIHNAEHTNRMASIGRLAAGVAHEINNPMAIINEKAGLLKDLIGLSAGNLPQKEKLLKQIDSIINSVGRCSEITHRLLGFARHMDVKNEPVAVGALIKDVLAFLETEATYRDILVDVVIDKALPTIRSDEGQLQQLFLNIINNAFDAMRKGGHLEIQVLEKPPDRVVVTIKDDGAGIPEKDLERIFEPFFSRNKAKGTGLGLSISYGIVKKLGGSIAVESKEGQGTIFLITLPMGRLG
jgi:signal transduction histidine kinase